MGAFSALGSGCVAAQNVELICLTLALPKNMLVNYPFVSKLSISLGHMKAQTPLFCSTLQNGQVTAQKIQAPLVSGQLTVLLFCY